MTRQQIADEMTRLQMTGGLLGFQTTREHLPDALRLLAHVMKEASFPADEFAQLQRQIVTGLSSQLDNPEALSRDAMSNHFNTYPPRRSAALHAAEGTDRGRAQAAARRGAGASTRDFYGTARGEIAVVGDFDAGQVAALVKELFTGFASRAPFARVEREYREVKPARIVIDTPDKENAIIRARLDFPLRDDDPDAPALTLANDIFGGGAGLSNRLIERLRQKDGLSYGAGTGPQRRLAQPRRHLGPGRDRRPAERGAGRAGDPRGTRARAPRRLHGEGSRGREEGHPAGAPRQPLAGRHRGRRAGSTISTSAAPSSSRGSSRIA